MSFLFINRSFHSPGAGENSLLFNVVLCGLVFYLSVLLLTIPMEHLIYNARPKEEDLPNKTALLPERACLYRKTETCREAQNIGHFHRS